MSRKPRLRGGRKSSAPVSLLALVCSSTSFFRQTKPKRMLTSRSNAINPTQTHSQTGSVRNGSSLIRQTARNMMSAMLSSFAPRALVLLVLRATKPSSMSLSPAARYSP